MNPRSYRRERRIRTLRGARLVLLPVLAALAIGAPARAADKPLPVSEEAVVKEMEAKIDAAAPLKDKEQEQVREYVGKGIKAFDAQDFEKAITWYRKALEVDPLNDVAYYELALTYSANGDQVHALDAVIRSLTVNPKSEMAYVLKGNILDNLGFAEEARKTYQSLLDVQPNSYQGLLEMGTCLFRLDQLDQAEASYKKASEVDPARPSAWFRLGLVAAKRGWEYDARRYFQKFLEVGKSDPRADTVRKMLADLDKTEIHVDPSSPTMSIDMIVALSRATWKKKHQQAHPDAHGYALTFEEEKDIDSKLIVPQWREEKKKNPKAAHPRYDLLLKVSDAGFLDEYIYYSGSKVIAEAPAWLDAHPDRVKAFEAWARGEGLLREEPSANASTGSAPSGDHDAAKADSPDPVFEMLRVMAESKVAYTVGPGTPAEAEKFWKGERERFAKAVKFSGTNKVTCPGSVSDLRERTHSETDVFVTTLRCVVPGQPLYDEATRLISTMGLRQRELDVRVQAAVVDGDEVLVKTVKLEWMPYANAKAAWRKEPELRARYGGDKGKYQPSVEEEMFVWKCAALAYERMRSSKDEPQEGKPEDRYVFEADPVLDRLVDISKSGELRGFVLFEILHQEYGISLESLSSRDAEAVDTYIRKWVFEKLSDKS